MSYYLINNCRFCLKTICTTLNEKRLFLPALVDRALFGSLLQVLQVSAGQRKGGAELGKQDGGRGSDAGTGP